NGWKQPIAIDLNILFDPKNNMDMVELRMLWKLKEQTEEIMLRNQSEERVEVGVFEYLHDADSYGGVRSIIGENKI
ncbi:20581_t:CDS:1, partial [Gigaspora rosea]